MFLPEIKDSERYADEVRLSLFVSDKIRYFEGHFPNFRLLPGVVQIHWAVELAKKYLDCRGEFDGMSAIKFVQPLKPNTMVKLKLNWSSEKRTISYCYEGELGKFSSGKVRLK